VWVSDYFIHSINICSSLFITLRYVTLGTSQNLTKQKLSLLHGRYYGVHLTPSRNKHKDHRPAVNISQTIKPQAETVKYLGLQFDRRLTWKDHIAKKRKQINLQIREINWLIERNPYPSI
jgi:hypothetical protein